MRCRCLDSSGDNSRSGKLSFCQFCKPPQLGARRPKSLRHHLRKSQLDRNLRDDRLGSGSDERSVRNEEIHCLSLHIRAHRRAGVVVVFEKWNERGRRGKNLLRDDIDVRQIIHVRQKWLAPGARGDSSFEKVVILVEQRIRLCNF